MPRRDRGQARSGRRSDQREARVGDAGAGRFMLRPQQHLVMRGTAGDHREAVFRLVHRDIGDHRGRAIQHRVDDVIQLHRPTAPACRWHGTRPPA